MTYSGLSIQPIQVLETRAFGAASDEPLGTIPSVAMGGASDEAIAVTSFSIYDPRPRQKGAVAVQTAQTLHLRASVTADWFQRTNEGAWSQFASGVDEVVLTTPSSIGNRFTFDRLDVAIGSGGSPELTTVRSFDVCEGPVAGLWIGGLRNEAAEEPPLAPWADESDDPPLGVPLRMAPANRDRLGTMPCQTADSGGPVNLVAHTGPGVFVDTTGRLGARTAFTNDVRGLGPFPAVAAWYHAGAYFDHDFGRGRTLGLTRVLYQDADSHVAVVRGDGRRNTYRSTGSAFQAASGLQSTLVALGGGGFEETSSTGRIYVYSAAGALEKVVDLRGPTAYYSYDADDRLQKIDGAPGAGALGLVPYLSYDGNGLLARLVLEDALDPANNRTSYFEYDGDRNLTRITGPELCVTYFEYNHPQRLSAVALPDGPRWYFAYDGSARVERIVDPLAQATYFAWDTSAPFSAVQDRVGKLTYFRYNAFGAPNQVWNPGTFGDYYEWDGDGNLALARNRLGDSWYYQYDLRGNRSRATDPLFGRSLFTYDQQEDLLQSTYDPADRQTRLSWDAQRNRTARIDPLGNTTYYQYEPTGLLRCRLDRRGAFTYFAFDARGNLTAVRDALGQTSYFAYNSANERTAQVDPLGRISYFEHDLRGRVVKAVNPIGAASYLAYDARCNLVQTTDALLRTVDHTYDANSNRVLTLLPATGDGVRNPSYWEFDAEERVTLFRDALNAGAPTPGASTMTYDVLGRPQKQTDALGGETYLVFDQAHQLVRRLDARGNASYLTYDRAGRATHHTNALLQQTYFVFNAAADPLITVDARGNATYFEYDPRGWQRQVKNAVGAVSYLAFDAEGQRVRTIDPLGKTTYLTYDLLGRLTHATDQLQCVSYMGYDAASQTVLRVDPLGAPSYMTYDQAGRPQTTLGPSGLLTYLAYDLVGNLVASTFDEGLGGARGTSYFAHDALDRRTSAIDPLGNVMSSVHDRNGNLTVQVDPRGFASYFTYDLLNRRTHAKDGVHFASTYLGYDPLGNVLRSVDPQGATVYLTYDALNRVSFQHDHSTGLLGYFVFDAVGNRIEQHLLLGAGGTRRSSYLQYDRVNRPIKSIAPDTGQTYMEFDLAGNQVRMVDPRGRPAYMAYDLLNRLRCRYNALLDKSYLEYDARSSVVKQIDGEGRTAYLGYDLAGRLLHQSNALGEFSYFGHDARGHRTALRNPRGYTTYFAFDLLGRSTHRTHALGGVAYMGYDEAGNHVLSVDELGNPSYFVFDGLGRQTQAIDALFAVSYLGFDDRSSPVLRIDAMGRCTYMGYDGARRLTGQWFANPVAGEVTDVPAYFTYNQASELTIVDDRLKGLGVSYFDHDSMGRVTKKVTAAGAVYYEFDLSGKRVSLKDPGLAKNYYVFDGAGQLVRELLDTRPVYFTYDKSGLLTRRLLPDGQGTPHRVMSYLFYDAAGRVSRLENRGSAWSTVINYFSYQRNENGLPTRVRREDGKDTYYQWDERDLLTFEQQQTGSTVELCRYHAYDLFGNRQLRTATETGAPKTNYYFFDPRNLDVKEGWPHADTPFALYFDHDDAQRLLARRITDGTASHYFAHDQEGRARSVELLPGSGGVNKFQMGFNAIGERVVKQDNNASSAAYLAWDGNKLMFQGTGGGSVPHYRYRHNWLPQNLTSLLEFDPTAFGYPRSKAPMDCAHVRAEAQDGAAATSRKEYDAQGALLGYEVGDGLLFNYHLRSFLGNGNYMAVTAGDMSLGTGGGWVGNSPVGIGSSWGEHARVLATVSAAAVDLQVEREPIDWGDAFAPLRILYGDEFERNLRVPPVIAPKPWWLPPALLPPPYHTPMPPSPPHPKKISESLDFHYAGQCICLRIDNPCRILVNWLGFWHTALGPVTVQTGPSGRANAVRTWLEYFLLVGAEANVRLDPPAPNCHLRQDTFTIRDQSAIKQAEDPVSIDIYDDYPLPLGGYEKRRFFDYSREATSGHYYYKGVQFYDGPRTTSRFPMGEVRDATMRLPAVPYPNPWKTFWQAHVFVEEAPHVQVWWGYAGSILWDPTGAHRIGFEAWSGRERAPFFPEPGVRHYGP